ncbi:Predicted ATPase [Desulfocicer vacuolatum DSM 3385]|uniref:Predicted ATPase n=1 Tax=Desulfocicer vacuolatum DSM 3385 TaxID=1121400 RepID=A0A1W2AZ63_9BACT|nr:DUF3696 domain-containing protein [Desulfocicer vacuolatum]SMC65894.1 Predicted ATPase [Desulfocicer vacuolatum DSM 3385]
MIDNIRVHNFKSLKNIDLPLKRLNIFAGLNGMGKSSLIQVLLLLRQSQLIRTEKLALTGALVNIGKGSDALYQFAEDEVLAFSLQWNEEQLATYEFEWMPESNYLDRISSSKSETDISPYIENLQYISADRLGPSIMYDMSQNSVKQGLLGALGEYTSHFLSVNGHRLKIEPRRLHPSIPSSFLVNQVNAWLGELSPGVKINVTEVPGADKMLLTYEFELQKGRTQPFKPTNVGFGITCALSIVVALLIAEKDQLIIIENPEAHIHPQGQAKLGKLMALAASSGAQIIVETHSDHVINGIRVAVKEGIIPPSETQCPWFHKVTTETEQYTDIINILIDKNGELSEYPEGFLEEWNNQLLRLI